MITSGKVQILSIQDANGAKIILKNKIKSCVVVTNSHADIKTLSFSLKTLFLLLKIKVQEESVVYKTSQTFEVKLIK